MNWEQLKTILWLRWRLTRNQWSRGGRINAVLATLVTICSVVLGVICFAAALLVGIYAMNEASPLVVMAAWFGLTAVFLFIWMIGLVAELQRSETIDLQRLMHLPVALGQMFVVNYLASHLALSIILLVPAMLGLAIGLAIARGPSMLLLIPLALSMVFIVSAWTYCLRGWLAALMTNPRRRRSIIMGVTFAFILISQGPNLYLNVLGRPKISKAFSNPKPGDTTKDDKAAVMKMFGVDKLLAVQKFIPLLWLPVGAQSLAEGSAWPALLGTLGGGLLGTLGLRRAYRSTVRFYHGQTGGSAPAKIETPEESAAAVTAAKSGARFLELRVPGVPEQAAALGVATFRSLLRAPEVKMAWATAFIVTVVVGVSLFTRSAPDLPNLAKPFLVTGAACFSLFLFVQFLANQFGYDRDGFRALILIPAERRHILLGKNLASLPVGGLLGLLLLIATSVWLRLPLLDVAAALFQLATALLIAGLVGNLLSILMPFRIAAGSLKPAKVPGVKIFLLVICQMFFPVTLLPVFISPLAGLLWALAGMPSAVPVNFLFSIAFAALMALLYWKSLDPLGRLLQRRETRILSIVTAEVE